MLPTAQRFQNSVDLVGKIKYYTREVSAKQTPLRVKGGGVPLIYQFPECQKCHQGVLLPLSDYGRDGASIRYKAWACSNPNCGFNIRIDNGELSMGKVVEQSNK